MVGHRSVAGRWGDPNRASFQQPFASERSDKGLGDIYSLNVGFKSQSYRRILNLM